MRPRLLDLFCGAGGAAMGYHRAGFEIVGVDIEPQPNYPFDFWREDALSVLRSRPMSYFDAIHASPPCQAYANVTRWRGNQDDHPELIAPTRELLQRTGLPYVIENVERAPIKPDLVLCGSMFGLAIRRHRWFELSWAPTLAEVKDAKCAHHSLDLAFEHKKERQYADAMGCPWMTAREGREAIPPAYTQFIGRQLATLLKEQAA